MNNKAKIILIIIVLQIIFGVIYYTSRWNEIKEHEKGIKPILELNITKYNTSFVFGDVSDLRDVYNYDKYYRFQKNNSEIETIDMNFTKVNLNTSGTTIVLKGKGVVKKSVNATWYLNNNTMVIE